MDNRSLAIPVSSATSNRPAKKAAAAGSSSAGGSGKLAKIHVTALDGIVSVNSLFTAAMFVGFSMTAPENATTASTAACTTSPATVRRLIVFEVVSFSFYLFSSLVAQSLKLRINLRSGSGSGGDVDPADPQRAHVNASHLKYCLFASAAGSVLGCTFLILSIVEFIRVKFGSLSCGGEAAYTAATLVILVGSGLVIYVITAVLALFFVEEEVEKYEEEEAEEEDGAIAGVEQNQP